MTSLDPKLVTTKAAKELLTRPVFPAIGTRPRPLGGHVAVNGYDLARVEAELQAEIDALLARLRSAKPSPTEQPR